jgi:hypothetical protein
VDKWLNLSEQKWVNLSERHRPGPDFRAEKGKKGIFSRNFPL